MLLDLHAERGRLGPALKGRELELIDLGKDRVRPDGRRSCEVVAEWMSPSVKSASVTHAQLPRRAHSPSVAEPQLRWRLMGSSSLDCWCSKDCFRLSGRGTVGGLDPLLPPEV